MSLSKINILERRLVYFRDQAADLEIENEALKKRIAELERMCEMYTDKVAKYALAIMKEEE